MRFYTRYKIKGEEEYKSSIVGCKYTGEEDCGQIEGEIVWTLAELYDLNSSDIIIDEIYMMIPVLKNNKKLIN